jgi:hypothetical protein
MPQKELEGSSPPVQELQPTTKGVHSLLASISLDHLAPCLEKDSLADLQARLAANRPLFMEHIRRLGVTKLGERQKLANGISKAERSGELPPAAVARFPHLVPAIFEDEKDTMQIRLKVAAGTTANQLKVHMEREAICVEYCNTPTSVHGKLCGVVRPVESTWQLERSLRPEYDPLTDAVDQAESPEDTLVISLQKEGRQLWRSLFADAHATRFVPPPPPVDEAKEAERKDLQREIDRKKHDQLFYGTPYVPSERERQERTRRMREKHAARERRRRDQATEDTLAAVSARDLWQSAAAMFLWREGLESVTGSPDHPDDTEPLYTWVETAEALIVRAKTEEGLPSSAMELSARRSSVDCLVRGRSTPWCGFLVGKVAPERCVLEALPASEPDAAWSVLQLTLAKIEPHRLWR